MRTWSVVVVASSLALAGCYPGPEEGTETNITTHTPTSTGGTTAGWVTGSTTGSSTTDMTLSTTDPTDATTTGPGPTTTTTGPEPVMCEPWPDPIPHPWIGAMCGHDDDCAYEDGFCLVEDEGFPCGHCTAPCDQFCPDLEGAPVTFCVDSSDLELAPPEGLCVSQCDPGLLGGDGCRDGYACVALSRFNEPATKKGVCIPDHLAPEQASCYEELEALGVAFAPTTHEIEHPDGHPDLDCIVEDPVLLYPPVAGVEFTYHNTDNDNPVKVSCEMAKAIFEMSTIINNLGGVEFQHIGTYNCRVIGGTNTLSQHGLAAAIDLSRFRLEDDTWLSVEDDWEKDVIPPQTMGGKWLRDLTDARYEQMVFNVILTPDYNQAHYNHFHVDLTEDGDFYK